MASCKDCISADVCKNRDISGDMPICEHFIDRNRFVELPCKVGNTLYMFNRNKSNIQEMVLNKPDIRCHCVKDDEFSSCMPICNDKENGICAYRFHLDFSEIGKTVFLTREEAERSLKNENRIVE